MKLKFFKKGLTFALLAALSAASLFYGCGAGQGDETVKLKYAHVFPTSHAVHKAALATSERLKQATDGKYELQIYPAGSYASYKDAIKAVRIGSLDICPLDTPSEWYPAGGALLSPFNFHDYDHWLRFKRSDLYQEFKKESGLRVGVKQFDYYTFGLRHTTTIGDSIPKSPQEFEGFRLRVVDFHPFPLVATVLNANPTPLPIGDVYMGLATGVIDGQENPFSQIYSMKFYEVQKNIILTGHMMTTSSTIMSDQAWGMLSDEEKMSFDEIFKLHAEFIDAEIQNTDQDLMKELEELGMNIVEVDKKPFLERVPLLYEAYPEIKDLHSKIQSL